MRNNLLAHFLLGWILYLVPTLVCSSSYSQIFMSPAGGTKHPQHTDTISNLISLHKDLISIESITGNEYDVGHYLHSYLSSRNFTVETQYVHSVQPTASPHDKPRLNIFAYRGTTRSTRLLVTSHMDTVGPYIPYHRTSNGEGNGICGRGSTDAKGCIASQILAVEELIIEGSIHEGDIGLLFVVGEEVNGAGMVLVW